MLAALCLAIVFAICLSSYVSLCYTSLLMSTRSIMSAHAVELAETGIEQALYAENNGDWSNWSLSITGSSATFTTSLAMTANGLMPTSSYPTPLNYGNGASGVANITVIFTSGVMSSIASQGVMTVPNASSLSPNAQTVISTTLTANGPTLGHTAGAPVFVNAVAAAVKRVWFQAAGTLDSFDSNPATGVYQQYSTTALPPVVGASAVVVAKDVTSLSATVRLNNAVVNGFAEGYDPFYPSSTNWLSYGGSGMVVGPTTSPSTSIDSTRLISSPVPYQPIFLESLPTATGSLPLAACNGDNILANPATLGTVVAPWPIYFSNGINLNGNTVVTVQGNVIIIVYGDVTIAGTAAIQMSPGASLAIYAENGNVNIGGSGIINTDPMPLAKKTIILSTNNTNLSNLVTFSPSSPFYGVLYFPFLRITVGSGSVNPTIIGSVVGGGVTFATSPIIHYDVALRLPDALIGDVAFTTLSAPLTFNGLTATVP